VSNDGRRAILLAAGSWKLATGVVSRQSSVISQTGRATGYDEARDPAGVCLAGNWKLATGNGLARNG
jgi:hypothetical protein